MKTSFLLHLLVYHAIETLRLLLLAASEASIIAAVIRISVSDFAYLIDDQVQLLAIVGFFCMSKIVQTVPVLIVF